MAIFSLCFFRTIPMSNVKGTGLPGANAGISNAEFISVAVSEGLFHRLFEFRSGEGA